MLGLDEGDLVVLRGALRLEAGDLLADLLDAELELLLAAFAVGEVALEQAGFVAGDDGGLGMAGTEARREFDRVEPVALGQEAGLPGGELDQLRTDDRKLGLRLGVLELDQDLAGPDEIAFPDRDAGDDAPVAMLDRLEVLVDGDGPGRDHGSRQLRGRRPSAGAADEQEAERQAQDDAWPDPEQAACRPPHAPWRRLPSSSCHHSNTHLKAPRLTHARR